MTLTHPDHDAHMTLTHLDEEDAHAQQPLGLVRVQEAEPGVERQTLRQLQW